MKTVTGSEEVLKKARQEDFCNCGVCHQFLWGPESTLVAQNYIILAIGLHFSGTNNVYMVITLKMVMCSA
jgi:hypothetical protein